MVDFLVMLAGLVLGTWGLSRLGHRQEPDRERAVRIHEIALRIETHVRHAAVVANRSQGILTRLIQKARVTSGIIPFDLEADLADAVMANVEQIDELHEVIVAIHGDAIELLREAGMKVRVEPHVET